MLLALALGACAHHPPLPAAPVRSAHCVGAISDLHLGDSRSLFEDSAGRAVVVGAVARAVREDQLDTLVLNGDVLELALAPEDRAYARAREVFHDLAAIDGLREVVLVVGNHDHKLFEELPGDDNLGKELASGTPFHQKLGDAAGKLRVTLVYPDWALPVAGGTVHFTHGHYFDPLVMPAFSGLSSVQGLESANREWLALINAGGTDSAKRAAYLRLYDTAQRGTAAYEKLLGHHPPGEGEEGADRDESRVAPYLYRMLGDEHPIAVVAGHTHHAGGLIAPIPYGDRTVTLFDTGGFVAGHRGIPMRAFLYEVNVADGKGRLVPIVVPADLERRAEDRAFSSPAP